MFGRCDKIPILFDFLVCERAINVTTAPISEEENPLLVYTSDDEELSGKERPRQKGNMAYEAKSSGVETHVVGGDGKGSDGLEARGENSGSMEMRADAHVGEEVDPEILERGIYALEARKTAWYAYLTTKDFWVVLVIGYVDSKLERNCAD